MASREATGREDPPPSKKQEALPQLSKEDHPRPDEEDGAVDGGTFRQAIDQILAERRMVTVRRVPVASSSTFAGIELAASSSTPCAGIELVAPTMPPTILIPQEPFALNSDASLVKPVVRQRWTLTTSVPGVTSGHNQKSEAVMAGFSAGGWKGIEVQQQLVVNKSVAPQLKDEDARGDVAEKKSDLAVEVKTDRGKSVDKSALSGDEVVKASGAELAASSSKSFEQLYSAVNAFAASFGTGFSSSPPDVNSSSLSAASSGAASCEPFTFGSEGFGVYRVGPPEASFGLKYRSHGAGPYVPGMLGRNNGSVPLPFFGSFYPAETVPEPTVVSLQEVFVETGEEKEKAIFKADAALFEFLDGGWKERGKGELRLNVSEEKHKRPRLVMRSNGNYRLLLNASLFPDMHVSKMDNWGISFVCANNVAEGRSGLKTYAVKLKDCVIAAQFTLIVQAHKGNADSEPKTPPNSPAAA